MSVYGGKCLQQLESTFYGLDEDVDDPYSSLLSMGATCESTPIPIT